MYQNMRKAGTTTGLDNQVPTGINIGNGVRIAATQKLYTQGNFKVLVICWIWQLRVKGLSNQYAGWND